MDKGYASKVSHSSTSPFVVESGETILVYGFVISNTEAPSGITVLDSDGNPITIFNALTDSSHVYSIPFYAKNGLQFTFGAGISVSVFHTQGGA